MPENMKRKITVESSSTKKDSQPRPSVFDRLGKKSSTSSTATTVVVNNESSGICRHWATTGNCPYGKNCKYAVTHTLISPSKQRAAKKDIVDTKPKTNSNTTHTSTLKSGIPSKEDLNKRLHSAVIRKGRTGTGGSPDLNWENWDQTDLEYEDEKVLEKRRQLLQRELELQMTKEKDDHQKKKKVKKVKKGSSSCSSTSGSSSSSTESTSSSDDSSSTSSSTSVDSRKKKAKKNTKRDSSSSTSGTDHATSKKKPNKSAKSGSLPSSKKTPAHKEDHRSGSSKVQESTTKKPVSAPANQTQTSMKKRSITPPDRSKRRSQTPPHLNDISKEKTSGVTKKPPSASTKHNLSPVAKRPASVDRKNKRSVSPHSSGRDREKAKSKDRDKEKEKEKDREKERDSGRVTGRNGTPPKGKPKDRATTPKRNSRGPRDPRKRDSPDAAKDKRRQSPSKSRRSSSRGRTRDEDKRAPSKNAAATSRDADRRDASRNDSRDSRGAVKNSDRDNKKNDDACKVTKSNKEITKSTSSSGRSRDDTNPSRRSDNSVVSSRETGRKMLPTPAAKSGSDRDVSSKGDKDRNKDPRDNSRDSRGGRDSARDGRGTNKDSADPRLPRNSKNIREMREAEREKEREEALERCRERQRERERKAQERERKVQERDRKVHELEEKAREHERELPSLLMIATHNPIKSVRNGGREDSKGRDKGSERGSDRSHEKDRGSDRDRDLDKGVDRERTNDRGSDRDRGPPSRAVERDRDRALDRSADKDRDRAPDRNADRNQDRDRGLERERGFDRGIDHERPLDRDRGLDRGPPERERGQERDRPADRGPLDRDRTFDRGLDRPQNKSPHRGINRGPSDRSYDRNADHVFEREPDRSGFERDNRDSDREYQPLGRGRDEVRRPPLGPDDKGSGYDSPYDGRRGREERGRYSDQLERNRYDDALVTREDSRRPGAEPRNYPDDRRGRRDPRASLEPAWDGRNRDSPESRRRPGYGEEPRSPPLLAKGRPGWEPPPVKGRPEWEPAPVKGRPEWEQREYGDGRREWDGRGGGRRGPPLDWDTQRRGDWIEKDSVHSALDEEWDMYTGPNAPPDWPAGGDRWPVDEWERPLRGTSGRPSRAVPHRDGSAPPSRDVKVEEPVKVEDIKKELPEVFPSSDPVAVKEEDAVPMKAEVQEVVPALKRPLDMSESEADKPEAKKVCLEESVPLEEDLSDISDDDADEILNREDIELASQAAVAVEDKLALAPAAVVVNGCSDSVKMETDQEKELEKFDKSADLMPHDINRDAADQSGLPDDETIDNLDFEEISDEELEEESKVGLADALGVDWASLVADCRPRARSEVAPGSARRHWEGHRMLARIGVSLRYAGQELFSRITDKFNDINKQREKDEKAVDEEDLEFLHPVAAIHVVLREKRERRKELLASAGPYKRALSARRDLLIRRQLCNLPVSEITVESQTTNTEDIYRLAIQLFERDD